MTRLTDETLMLFADGMLDRAEGERVGRLVAADPHLRARLNVFRATGQELARLFDEHMRSPLPPRLQEFFAGHGAPAQRAPLSRHRRGSALARMSSLRLPAWSAPAALAASLTLIAGIGLGWLLRGPGDAMAPRDFVQVEDSRLFARGALERGLETARSGTDTKAAYGDAQEARIHVRMTFRNEARDYCRQYEITAATAARHAGVACRIDGRWVVTMQALLPPPPPADRMVLAGGGQNEAMEAAVGAMIDGDPFGRDEEAAVIGNGWRR